MKLAEKTADIGMAHELESFQDRSDRWDSADSKIRVF